MLPLCYLFSKYKFYNNYSCKYSFSLHFSIRFHNIISNVHLSKLISVNKFNNFFSKNVGAYLTFATTIKYKNITTMMIHIQLVKLVFIIASIRRSVFYRTKCFSFIFIMFWFFLDLFCSASFVYRYLIHTHKKKPGTLVPLKMFIFSSTRKWSKKASK